MEPSPSDDDLPLGSIITDSIELWPIVLVELLKTVTSELLALGPDIEVIPRKSYLAFKRRRVFAYVLPVPTQKVIVMTVHVNPDKVKLEPGFTRDVRKIRGVGSGSLEIIVRTEHDLKKAVLLLKESYESR